MPIPMAHAFPQNFTETAPVSSNTHHTGESTFSILLKDDVLKHWQTTHERYHRAQGSQLSCSSLSQLAVSRMGKSTDAPELYYTLLSLFQALKAKANTLNYMRNARQAWNWSVTCSLERNVSQTRNNTVRSSFTHNPCRQKINTLRFIPWLLDLRESVGNTVVSQNNLQNSNCLS